MMKKMTKIVIVALLALSQIAPYAAAVEAQEKSETQILVDLLVESKVLTVEQGEAFASRAKTLAEKKEKTNEPVRKEYRDVSESGSGNVVITKWDKNLKFETRDGNFKGEIGGNIHTDVVYLQAENKLSNFLRSQGDFDKRNDRALVSEARIYMKGDVYKDFFYKLQYDFGGEFNNESEVDGFRGAYIGMRNIPYVGKVTVGQFKEPFSLEEVSSDEATTFVERGLPNVFVPGYSWGAGMQNSWFDDRVTFALGAFRNSLKSEAMAASNNWNLTTRATGLPWYEDKDKFLEVGTSYRLSFPTTWASGRNNNTLDFQTGPELSTRDNFVNTTDFNVNMENLLGLESAFVYGPLSLQGEFIQCWLDDSYDVSRISPDTSAFYGGYVYASYFITGEHRNFDKSRAEFECTKPKNNFSIEDRTWGAWEVAVRYSHLDLNDKSVNINGGILNDMTFGINWYLNPSMRVMVNYVHSVRNGIGYADGVQARFQVNF